jgi:hypothetical protein
MVGLLLLGMLKSETILKVVEGVRDAIKHNQTEWAVVVVIDFLSSFFLLFLTSAARSMGFTILCWAGTIG